MNYTKPPPIPAAELGSVAVELHTSDFRGDHAADGAGMSARVKRGAFRRTCRTCGWTGVYSTATRGDYAKRRHSCEKHLRDAFDPCCIERTTDPDVKIPAPRRSA